eukprot:202725-Hanusia_phi.AAC.1
MKRRRVVVTVVTRNGLRITAGSLSDGPDWPLIACRRTTRPAGTRDRAQPGRAAARVALPY